LASSSRTWFSTGINNTGFFNVISLEELGPLVIPAQMVRLHSKNQHPQQGLNFQDSVIAKYCNMSALCQVA
jgi:hypothetical protein